jgi:hypothetical protein
MPKRSEEPVFETRVDPQARPGNPIPALARFLRKLPRRGLKPLPFQADKVIVKQLPLVLSIPPVPSRARVITPTLSFG